MTQGTNEEEVHDVDWVHDNRIPGLFVASKNNVLNITLLFIIIIIIMAIYLTSTSKAHYNIYVFHSFNIVMHIFKLIYLHFTLYVS